LFTRYTNDKIHYVIRSVCTILNQMLDKNSPIPLYYQLKIAIQDYIRVNQFNPRDRLPSLNELSAQYGVSIAVVRQAIQGLVQERIVEAQQGRGIFVAFPKHRYSLDLLSPKLFETSEEMGIKLSISAPIREVLPASTDIAERLKLPIGESVIHALKVRFANEIPLMLADAYYPYSFCPDLAIPELNSDQLNNLLEDRIYPKIIKSETWVSAKIAGKKEANLLNIDIGEPMIVFEGLSKNAEMKPIQFYIACVVSRRLRMGVNIEQLEMVL
jgi:GntR family transcriptional regulator